VGATGRNTGWLGVPGAVRRRGTRIGIAALWLLTLLTGGVRAQDTAQVRLEISLAEDTTTAGTRAPVVRTWNLLRDPQWRAILESGLPLRLHYRIELWRSRGAWFDAAERQIEWDVAVRHEPLLDQYTVVRLSGKRRQENRYATFEALSAVLGRAYRVTTAPTDPGEYYYIASLQLTTLSDTDLDELERFFEEDVAPAAQGKEEVGSAVGRAAKRLVLKLAGLPSLHLEQRSDRFRVGP